MCDKVSDLGEQTYVNDELSVGIDRQFEGAFFQRLGDSRTRFLSSSRLCELPGLCRIQQIHCLFHGIVIYTPHPREAPQRELEIDVCDGNPVD